MTFAAVAIASLPVAANGRLAGTISPENEALAKAVLAILDNGEAAQSSDVFVSRQAAGNEGRRVAKVCTKVETPAPGMAYRVRAFEAGEGFTFALYVGKAPAPRKPSAAPAEAVAATA